jgi:hypothetical protein
MGQVDQAGPSGRAGPAYGMAVTACSARAMSPGVQVFWPLPDSSWMVTYRWFLGLIVVFTAARLVLVSVGLPHTRIPVFWAPSPSGSIPCSPG